jgi:predicted DCC family thiol-disulfide oxidoreductase YuxK
VWEKLCTWFGGVMPQQRLPEYTVVYDGACGVCTRIVALLLKWDREHVLESVPLQDPRVQERFSWILPSAFRESVQLVRLRDGLTWEGARAVEVMIDAMPKGRWIGWVFSIPYVRPVAERFYKWFAKNRYRLTCGEHCEVGAKGP